MQELDKVSFAFDEFQLDVPKRRLLRNESPVHLNPKAFDLLVILVENSGRLLTKEDLFKSLWQGRVVEESNLSVYMAQIRKALGESAKQPRYISTVSGEGYRFVGNVRSGSITEDRIERHSYSRIVIEEGIPDETPNDAVDKLPARRSDLSSRFGILLFGVVVIAALVTVGYFLRERFVGAATVPFQSFEIKRLPLNGLITYATLSGDGKLVAYSVQEPDGQASLWLGHVNGSREIKLRDTANVIYSFIKFAPDGNHLYFTMNTEPSVWKLYRMPAFGGKAEELRDNVLFAALAPDGGRYAFVRNLPDRSALVLCDMQGNERELATRTPALAFSHRTVAWSSDGKTIAAAANINGEAETKEIFVTDIESGRVTQVTDLGWQLYRSVAWLNEGGLIVVAAKKSLSSGAKLVHIALPGGEAKQIITDLNAYGQLIDVSADNSVLLALQAQHQANIWQSPADNIAAARQLTFDSLGRNNGWYGLDWLPEDKLVYTAASGEYTHLWARNPDGSGEVQLTSGESNDLHQSSTDDGRRIVFESDRDGNREIWSIDSTGGNLQKVTTGGRNTQPHVSPDGKWIAFVSGSPERKGIWIRATEGDSEIRLTTAVGSFPRFSPDGRYIAYASNTGEKSTVSVIPIEGGPPTPEFSTPRFANLNLGVRWTPDGRAVTYRDWVNGIWRQDLDGAQPERIAGLPAEKLYAYGWSRDGSTFAYARGQEIRDVVVITATK